MKRSSIFISCAMAVLLAACSGGADTNSNDTTVTKGADSMPVIKPRVTDTGGTVITPPVNDNNVIVPDSAIKKQ